MVWNFTAYILWKYAERIGTDKGIQFREFSNFVFLRLGRKKKLFFHDGKSDLLRDVEYLEGLGFINIQRRNERVDDWIIEVNKERLKAAAESLKNLTEGTGIGLMKEYLKRIDQAIDEYIPTLVV